jgi:hypothetical protein
MKAGCEIGNGDGVVELGYVMREHADGWQAGSRFRMSSVPVDDDVDIDREHAEDLEALRNSFEKIQRVIEREHKHTLSSIQKRLDECMKHGRHLEARVKKTNCHHCKGPIGKQK